jgi:hypothetical protein
VLSLELVLVDDAVDAVALSVLLLALVSVMPTAFKASAIASAKPPPSCGGGGGRVPSVALALLVPLVLLVLLVLLKRLRKLSALAALLELRALMDIWFSAFQV